MRIEVHGGGHRWWVLATVGIGVFMATLDASVVNISLPTIIAYFKSSLAASEWVILAYLLVITSLLLPFGRLADLTGRKKVYRLGFVIFSLGSALSAFSMTLFQLIAFRAIQAVGAAMLMANGFAIVTTAFPIQERGRALGLIGAVVAVGFTIGPSLGGFLVNAFGWRSIFYVNIPIGIVGILMTTRILNERQVSPTLGEKGGFDFLGAALVIIGLTCLLLGLTAGQEGKWGTASVIIELAVAGIALALVPVRETRTSQPLIDFNLFKIRLFSFGNLAGFLSFLAVSANAFLMPFFLQLALGYNPLQAGLVMTPTALAIAIVSPVSGWLSDRMGARLLSSLGLAINTGALIWISRLETQAGYQEVLIRLVLIGIGQGLFQSPNNSSVMGSVPRHSLGIAGGFLSMMRNMGQVAGTALAGTILAGAMMTGVGHAYLGVLHPAGPPGEKALVLAAFMSGMHRAYLAGAFISFVGMWFSLVRGKHEHGVLQGPPPSGPT